MQNTMQLLEKALSVKSAAEWHKHLNLSRNTLHTAKNRGNLSPAIAGALADELGEDAAAWMVIAALEGERESACKTRMIKKFIAGSALALGSTAALAAPAIHAVCALCQIKVKARKRRKTPQTCKRRKTRTRRNMAGFFMGV